MPHPTVKLFHYSFLSEAKAQEGSLLNAVNILLGATETENREKALNELRNIIIDKHDIFDNYDMHDAQEFLQILLQNLAVSFLNSQNKCQSGKPTKGKTTLRVRYTMKKIYLAIFL